MDLRERQRIHFNSIADRYKSARKHSNHLLLKQLMWARALDGIDQFQGKQIKVIEPMCGFGDGKAILENYLKADVVYSGYDYSDNVIETFLKEDPEVNCWKADATIYDPPAAQYDVVILLGGLHHVPEHAEAVVARTAKALRPGGIYINLEPTSGNAVFRKVREAIYKRNSLFDDATERAFECKALLSMFGNAGLTPIKIMFPGLLSYVLYYNPDAFPRLNLGGDRLVRAAFKIDSPFLENVIGRCFSFATLSIWEQPNIIEAGP
jgi:SAM-dependent methyltransferase